MEIWKDIKGFEGHYQVSNLGRVKSIKGGEDKILKPLGHTSPYLRVCFWVSGKPKHFYIHSLVLEAFIEKPDGYDYANHKDRDHKNNRWDNLEWVNGYENQAHRKLTSKCSSRYIGVSFHKSSRKWRSMIAMNGNHIELGRFESEIDAAKAYINFCADNGIKNRYLVYPE